MPRVMANEDYVEEYRAHNLRPFSEMKLFRAEEFTTAGDSQAILLSMAIDEGYVT